jgi:hypothetical protein
MSHERKQLFRDPITGKVVLETLKTLPLLLKSDGTYEFVSCSSDSEYGHWQGVLGETYNIGMTRTYHPRHKWFYNNFVFETDTPADPSDSRPETYPQSFLIRKRDGNDMTLDDFKRMITSRFPNPNKHDQIEIDKLLQNKPPETLGWCTIL